METINLKKYLSDVLGREQALFTLNRIKDDISQRMNAIITAPKSLNAPEPPCAPAMDFGSVSYESRNTQSSILAIGMVICIVAGFFADVFWGIGVVVIIVGIVEDFIYKNNVISERKERYNNDYAHYISEKKRIEKENERLKIEQAATLESLRIKHTDVELHIKETQSTLETLYALDVIFGKYRYFVAVASICEYFQSGRCDSLEGHEGAYNLYENELRQNIIIGQLSEVIRELQQIRNAQYLIYEAVNESNRILQNISSELNSINQNIITSSQNVVNRLGELKDSVDSSAKSSSMTAYFAKESANNSRLLVEINRGDYGLLFDKKGNVVYSRSQ